MRLIDAEQMKKKLNEWIDATGCDVFTKHHIMAFLNDCDAVLVVHGKWTKEGLFLYRCSNCNDLQMLQCYSNFCPHCGAKMD